MNTSLFDNTETAFELKTNKQLNRAYFLFKMISYNTLVKAGTVLTSMALKLNLPVKGLIRSTVFDHFCGGVNEDDCLTVVNHLYTKKVKSILDYSVEGKETEAQFDAALEKNLQIINFCMNRDAMPIAVFKPTGLGRFYLYQKKTEGKAFTTQEQQEWDRIVKRYKTLCEFAYKNDVKILIDGEESWMQDAADDLVEEMMQLYNKDKITVYNTLQCYRWDRLDYLKALHKRAKAKSFKIGVKIVRGAYMEKERERAEAMDYPSPICKDKKTTDKTFNDTLNYCVAHIKDISTYLGTHNMESCYLAMQLMADNNIKNNNANIWFGQLYGMSDNISFNLAKEGYNVTKYIPFGPVKDVMPYLIRRAQENTSVSGQTSRELTLIKAEKQRRKL